MTRRIISTDKAPRAIGTYSQAVRAGSIVYISGQIPLDPVTMQIVAGDMKDQVRRVFESLKAVAEAAGGSLSNVVKLTVYLRDLRDFPLVNEVMGEFFAEPYPARAAVGVSALPKDAGIEIEAVMETS
jgi:reactive intermediate/imine deaminase